MKITFASPCSSYKIFPSKRSLWANTTGLGIWLNTSYSSSNSILNALLLGNNAARLQTKIITIIFLSFFGEMKTYEPLLFNWIGECFWHQVKESLQLCPKYWLSISTIDFIALNVTVHFCHTSSYLTPNVLVVHLRFAQWLAIGVLVHQTIIECCIQFGCKSKSMQQIKIGDFFSAIDEHLCILSINSNQQHFIQIQIIIVVQ